MSIRDVSSDDFQEWQELWQCYLKFYQTELSEDVTKATWDKFFDKQSSVSCHVAEEQGHLVAFAVSVVHPSTWSKQENCYLEDLFVSEGVRGKGIGQALIQHLIDLAPQSNWSRVYWHTDTDNAVARKLYDKFKPADDVVRYKVEI